MLLNIPKCREQLTTVNNCTSQVSVMLRLGNPGVNHYCFIINRGNLAVVEGQESDCL